ncbi:hypothetical protein EIM48_04995 [Pseudoxanthomonas sp. SGNA-20]|uniref:hypothetical protein n=1 Tax=unclassified Pseudoxanthomonas TaxID=2645906 RepID=UPI000F62B536|nr:MULTISPECIES: hypothetical protein [unclassified Pseudoxanthomonas]RRN59386.1 hypothetical protein EIM48_04995 [Pseudoxanthomonas sp. SGNA-20]
MKNLELKSGALALAILLAAGACNREQPAPDPGSADAAQPAAGDGAASLDDPGAEQHRNMVRAGAALYVAPEFCGLQYDDAERARMREQQKQLTVERGHMGAAQFDAIFDAGIDEAREAFANASPEELKQTCDTIRAMHGAAPQG